MDKHRGDYRADPAQVMLSVASLGISWEPGSAVALLLCSILLSIYQPAVEATDQVWRGL